MCNQIISCPRGAAHHLMPSTHGVLNTKSKLEQIQMLCRVVLGVNKWVPCILWQGSILKLYTLTQGSHFPLQLDLLTHDIELPKAHEPEHRKTTHRHIRMAATIKLLLFCIKSIFVFRFFEWTMGFTIWIYKNIHKEVFQLPTGAYLAPKYICEYPRIPILSHTIIRIITCLGSPTSNTQGEGDHYGVAVCVKSRLPGNIIHGFLIINSTNTNSRSPRKPQNSSKCNKDCTLWRSQSFPIDNTRLSSSN